MWTVFIFKVSVAKLKTKRLYPENKAAKNTDEECSSVQRTSPNLLSDEDSEHFLVLLRDLV